jgi:hypothetical protein
MTDPSRVLEAGAVIAILSAIVLILYVIFFI